MSRQYVQDAARISRFVAALLACVVLGRFALSSTAWATERSKGTREAAARPDLDHARADASTRESNGDAATADGAQKLDVQSGKPEASVATEPKDQDSKPKAAPKRRTLLVDLGKPRSDVYVNGVLVGRTPYAGTWSCRDGDDVNIVVMGSGAALPIAAHAHCGIAIVADDRADTRKLDDKAVDEIMSDAGVGSALKNALKSRTR